MASPQYLFGKKIEESPSPIPISPNKKTSPLSSWFLSPGGAPNFGKPDQEAAEYTQIRTSGGTGKGELVTALNKEIEENDEFTQQLLASLAEGALDHQQTNNTLSIPGSPST